MTTSFDYSDSVAPRRSMGLVLVVLFHALLIYALVTGMAHDAIKMVQHKVEVSVIEDAPPPPPPPPPPKIEKLSVPKPTAPPPPQQAFAPPPEVVPQTAPAAAIVSTTATATAATVSPAAAVAAPTVAQGPVGPPVQSKPAATGPSDVVGVCSVTAKPEYPKDALAEGIEGSVSVLFNVDADGKFSGIADIKFHGIDAGYRSSFQSAITKALRRHQCRKDLGQTLVQAEYDFNGE